MALIRVFALSASTILAAWFICFSLNRLLPSTYEDISAQESELGVQSSDEKQGYLDELGERILGFKNLSLGKSVVDQKDVTSKVFAHFGVSILLAAISALLSLGLAMLFISTLKMKNELSATLPPFFFASVPTFVLAPVLIFLFGVHGPKLPFVGIEQIKNFILPIATLTFGSTAYFYINIRNLLFSEMPKPYFRSAIAKGLSYRRAVLKHALPNLKIPIVSIASLHFCHLVASAIIVETIFSIPGLGRLIYESILIRDLPTVEAGVLLITALFVSTNETINYFSSIQKTA